MTEKQRIAENKRRREARAAAKTDKAANVVPISEIAAILREGIAAINASANRIERAVQLNAANVIAREEPAGERIKEYKPTATEGKPKDGPPPLQVILEEVADRSHHVLGMAESLRSRIAHGGLPVKGEEGQASAVALSHGPAKDAAFATSRNLSSIEEHLEFFAQYFLP